MTLGSHELKGKVENLKQPFVVMRKKRKRDDTECRPTCTYAAGTRTGNGDFSSGDVKKNDCTMMDVDTGGAKSAASSAVMYEVAGVVKKKLLFDNYPKSIMR